MYFSISPSLFNTKIDQITPFLSAAYPIIEIQANANNGVVTIVGTNSLAHASNRIDAKVTTSGSASVNADLLSKLIRTYSISQVYIRLDITKTKLMLSSNSTFPQNATISIPVINSALMTPPKSTGTGKIIEVDTQAFKVAVASLKALKYNGNVNNNLKNAVRIKFNNNNKLELSMMSMRGIVVASVEAKQVLGQLLGEVNIPYEVLSNLPDTDYKELVIEQCINSVIFGTSDYTIISNTLSGSIQDHNAILSTKSSGSLTVQTKDILPILKRASLLLDQTGNSTKSVTFNLNNDQLQISINSSKGQYADYIYCCQIGLQGNISFIIDDLISSIQILFAESVTLTWVSGVVSVTASSASKKQGVDITSIIRTINTNQGDVNNAITKQSSDSAETITKSQIKSILTSGRPASDPAEVEEDLKEIEQLFAEIATESTTTKDRIPTE